MLVEGLKRTESAMAEVAFVRVDIRVECELGGLIADQSGRRSLGESMRNRDGGNYVQGVDSGRDLVTRDVMASARLDV